MRRRATGRVLVLACVVALAGVTAPGAAQDRSSDEVARDLRDAEAERDRRRDELGGMRAEVAAARAELVALQTRLREATARLRVAEGQLALAEEALVDAEAARDAAVDNLELARRLLDQAEGQLAEEEAAFRAQVATAYKYGAAGRGTLYLEVLRQARTPNDVAVGLYHLGSVMDHQDRVVTRVADLRAERAALEDRAAATRVAAAERELDATATLAVVTDLRADAAALAAAIAADEARQREVLASLEADAAEQAALVAAVDEDIAALEEELAASRRRRGSVGGFTCPVVPSWFQNDWGFPRSGGRSHEGTDVFADRGTPVVAVADGTVKAVDRRDDHRPGTSRGDLGGRSVSVWTAPGEYWYFAHLEAVADGLRVGDRVVAGEPLGTTGNSGNARTTPPHTHVGRYVDGSPVNPYPALDAACR